MQKLYNSARILVSKKKIDKIRVFPWDRCDIRGHGVSKQAANLFALTLKNDRSGQPRNTNCLSRKQTVCTEAYQGADIDIEMLQSTQETIDNDFTDNWFDNQG